MTTTCPICHMPADQCGSYHESRAMQAVVLVAATANGLILAGLFIYNAITGEGVR